MDMPFGGWDEQAEDVEAAAEAASIIEAAEGAWGGNFISWEGYGHPPIFEKLGKFLIQLENRDQTTHVCLISATMMSWVQVWVELIVLLKDSEVFILFAENSQILLKISVTPVLLTFMSLVALYQKTEL